MKQRKKINFILADDLILIHSDDLEYSRKIVLEALFLVLESNTHVLAQKPLTSDSTKKGLINYIESLP